MPTLQLCLEEETGHRPGRAVHLHPAPPPRRRLIIAGLLLPGVVAAPALRLVTARKSASSEILILNIPISDPSSFAQKPAPTPAPSARLEQCAHSLNPIVVVLCSKPFVVFLSTTQPAKLPPRKCGRAPTACQLPALGYIGEQEPAVSSSLHHDGKLPPSLCSAPLPPMTSPPTNLCDFIPSMDTFC